MKNYLAIVFWILPEILNGQVVPFFLPTHNLVGFYYLCDPRNNEDYHAQKVGLHGPKKISDPHQTNYTCLFENDSDNIIIDTPIFNNGWSNYTISIWLKPSENLLSGSKYPNSKQTILQTFPGFGLLISYEQDSDDKFIINSGSNLSNDTWDIYSNIHLNKHLLLNYWNNIIITKANDSEYKFYLNGVIDSSLISNIKTRNNYCKIIIGNSIAKNGHNAFKGSIDELGIWACALTSNEIESIYKKSAPPCKTYIHIK